MRRVLVLVFLILNGAAMLHAQPTFDLRFEGLGSTLQTDCDAGTPGRADVAITLETRGAHEGDGPHAWSLAMQVDGAARIDSLTLAETAAAERGENEDAQRIDGFVHNELTEGAGNEGAVSAVILSLALQGDSLAELPVSRRWTICRLSVESTSPPCDSSQATLRFVNNLEGSGLPVRTVISWRGESYTPTATSHSFRVGPIQEDSFLRGDPNRDGSLDLSDGIFVLSFLFLGAEAPYCEKSADINDSGFIDLSDAVRLFSFLFLGGETPPPPTLGNPGCGSDPTPDGLGCPPDSCS